MPIKQLPLLSIAIFALGFVGVTVYVGIQPAPVSVPIVSSAPPMRTSRAPEPEHAIDPPRPYLTRQVEEYVAHDKCTIDKQRCRKDGVCITCFICPYDGRDLLGSSFTKCKSPTDCIDLTDNVAWTRENVDPGWCEGMPFKESI